MEESLEAALSEEPRPGATRKLTGSAEVLLIATTCSTPPTGRARWTLVLLADAVAALTPHAQISRHTIGRRLAEDDRRPVRGVRSSSRGARQPVHAHARGVLRDVCARRDSAGALEVGLARRIPDLDTLTTEVDAWRVARNHAGAAITRMFGIEQARTKLGHAYPTREDAAREPAA